MSRTISILSTFGVVLPGQELPFKPRREIKVFCIGLPAVPGNDIHIYLSRSPAAGGGAPPLHVLCKKYFKGVDYDDLCMLRIQKLRSVEAQKYIWVNRRTYPGAVYSNQCLQSSTDFHASRRRRC